MTAPTDIAHGKLRALHRYWESLRPSPDLLPGRQHFQAEDIWPWIGHIGMVDVERVNRPGVPFRFRIRLQGDHLARLTGNGQRGLYLDETLHTQYRDLILAQHSESVATGMPIYRVHTDETKAWKRIDRLVLPFASDGHSVDLLMTGLYMAVTPTQPCRNDRP
ncbi:MAG: PAS domain-containing protein [Oceanibaculum sp.]